MTYENNEFDFAKHLLIPGENILWKGKPEKGAIFTRQDIIMIPFSIFWCGFAFFWFFGALEAGGFFALFGIPFILVGLYLVAGRFFITAHLRKNTAYVITNKKIIRKKGKKIDMIEIATLPPMHTELHQNGCGTITFGEPTYSYRSSRSRGYVEPAFSLENIADVIRIQALISSIEV